MWLRTTTAAALLLACLLLLTAPSSIFGEENAAAPTMTNEEAASSMADSAVQAVNQDGMPGPGERKVFGTDDEQVAEMNVKLQQVFLDKVLAINTVKRSLPYRFCSFQLSKPLRPLPPTT